jgi:hypothetical protein
VADRGDAEADQVVGRQLGQDLAVDVVVAERPSYRSKPNPRNQAPTSTPSLRSAVLTRVGARSMPSRYAVGTADVAAAAVVESALVLSGLSPVAGKGVRLTFDGGRLTSDAGVLALAEIERRLGIAERLACCLEDPRTPGRVRHTLAEMIRFRVLLIAAGYPDANDCDTLRTDPAFKWRLATPRRVGRICALSRPCAGSRTCPAPSRSSA